MLKWIKKKFKKKVSRCKDKRAGFTGLEVITHVDGQEVTRCLFEAGVEGLTHHWYLIPTRLSDCEELKGYTIKMHKQLI